MIVIDCGRCVVRSFRTDDAPSLAWHADNPRVAAMLRDAFPQPYTVADARAWIGYALHRHPQTMLAIAVDGEAVGGIGLTLHDDIERVSAEVGYWLGEAWWGQGITTAALRGLTRWAFDVFPLTRLYAVPFADNTASCRVLEKAGYVCETVMRRSAIKHGLIRDQALYARLRP